MIKDTIPGVVGNCVSGGAWLTAWFTAYGMPALHVFSVVLGIVASIATAGYYFTEWRAARAGRQQQTKRRRAVQRKKSR